MVCIILNMDGKFQVALMHWRVYAHVHVSSLEMVMRDKQTHDGNLDLPKFGLNAWYVWQSTYIGMCYCIFHKKFLDLDQRKVDYKLISFRRYFIAKFSRIHAEKSERTNLPNYAIIDPVMVYIYSESTWAGDFKAILQGMLRLSFRLLPY